MKQWHKSRGFTEALTFALRGIRDAFQREQNVRIQFVVGALVVCMMLFLRIPPVQMTILILASMIVIVLELINASLELFSDIVHPEYHKAIKSSKDIAAGAVLVAGVSAAIVGLLIFVPAIMDLL